MTSGSGYSEDPALLKRAFHLDFTEMGLPAGGKPMLPGGAQGISMNDAISAALSRSPATGMAGDSGGLRAGVRVFARYGIFTDEAFGPMGAGGVITPVIKDRPVWIVSFTGVKYPITSPRARGLFHTGISVVVDALTGKALESYNYQ
ncbi:MAG: hypothetical protein ACRDFX_03460 [Chloroflexota bacterium]